MSNELEQSEDRLLSIILMYSCGNYFEGIRKTTKKTSVQIALLSLHHF